MKTLFGARGLVYTNANPLRWRGRTLALLWVRSRLPLGWRTRRITRGPLLRSELPLVSTHDEPSPFASKVPLTSARDQNDLNGIKAKKLIGPGFFRFIPKFPLAYRAQFVTDSLRHA